MGERQNRRHGVSELGYVGEVLWEPCRDWYFEEPGRVWMDNDLALRREEDRRLLQAAARNRTGQPAEHPLLNIGVRILVDCMIL